MHMSVRTSINILRCKVSKTSKFIKLLSLQLPVQLKYIRYVDRYGIRYFQLPTKNAPHDLLSLTDVSMCMCVCVCKYECMYVSSAEQ